VSTNTHPVPVHPAAPDFVPALAHTAMFRVCAPPPRSGSSSRRLSELGVDMTDLVRRLLTATEGREGLAR
jgi:hypothetical protein